MALRALIYHTYIVIPNKIHKLFFTLVSIKARIMFLINYGCNAIPKSDSIPSKIMIFFISISTLIDEDTYLSIGPFNHFYDIYPDNEYNE